MRLSHFLFILMFATLAVVGFFVGFYLPLHSAQEKALCDVAVHELLHTKDPVELMRYGFIVNHLNCSISRRLQ